LPKRPCATSTAPPRSCARWKGATRQLSPSFFDLLGFDLEQTSIPPPRNASAAWPDDLAIDRRQKSRADGRRGKTLDPAIENTLGVFAADDPGAQDDQGLGDFF